LRFFVGVTFFISCILVILLLTYELRIRSLSAKVGNLQKTLDTNFLFKESIPPTETIYTDAILPLQQGACMSSIQSTAKYVLLRTSPSIASSGVTDAEYLVAEQTIGILEIRLVNGEYWYRVYTKIQDDQIIEEGWISERDGLRPIGCPLFSPP